MGFINKTAAKTVKATLTAQGTKYLLTDPARFNITQFGLADDEVDYSLYNEQHVNGSDFYGDVIENMPVLEPISNSFLQCRFWLLTGVHTGTIRVPGFLFAPSTNTGITLEYADSVEPLRITLINADEGNARIEYRILDTSLFDLNVQGGNHTVRDISGLAHEDWAQSTVSPFTAGKVGQFDLASAQLTLTPKRWDLTNDGRSTIEFTHLQSNSKATYEITVKKNIEHTSG